MVRMLFTLPQNKARVVALPNGMYDVTVLDNEELVDVPSGENGEISVKMYQYDGNQFRTVYELTEEGILSDLSKWLDYDAKGEPTLEQIEHDNAIIAEYQSEIENAIKEVVNE